MNERIRGREQRKDRGHQIYEKEHFVFNWDTANFCFKEDLVECMKFTKTSPSSRNVRWRILFRSISDLLLKTNTLQIFDFFTKIEILIFLFRNLKPKLWIVFRPKKFFKKKRISQKLYSSSERFVLFFSSPRHCFCSRLSHTWSNHTSVDSPIPDFSDFFSIFVFRYIFYYFDVFFFMFCENHGIPKPNSLRWKIMEFRIFFVKFLKIMEKWQLGT